MSLLTTLMSSGGGSSGAYAATDVFQPTAYNGTGSSQSIVNGVNLAGNGGFVWIKSRLFAASHMLIDSQFGVSNFFNSNSTNSGSEPTAVTSFNSNGFTVGTSANTNQSTDAVISWTFRKAAGFLDVVSYAGAAGFLLVNHALGVVPELIIFANRDAAADKVVYHKDLGATKGILLNSTGVPLVDSSYFNDTAPTTTKFAVNFALATGQANNYTAYLFASKAGISKVGSYVGNGTSQTIDCGFSAGARFIMIKNTSASGNWAIFDTARGYNTSGDPIVYPNATSIESATNDDITYSATGFTVNTWAPSYNTSGQTYIYLAIA